MKVEVETFVDIDSYREGDKLVAVGISSGGDVIRTDDSGCTWVRLPKIPHDSTPTCIHITSSDLWMVGFSDGTLMCSADKGKTWKEKEYLLLPVEMATG